MVNSFDFVTNPKHPQKFVHPPFPAKNGRFHHAREHVTPLFICVERMT